jgi:hypothetical protein
VQLIDVMRLHHLQLEPFIERDDQHDSVGTVSAEGVQDLHARACDEIP